ncbi:MAG: hypothetical protein DI536_14700 [Archangium gephyra]|uniref:Uncharacterized protein n=1 Tax=Archangium gephyra TaxID=48 RepID=A0A2W5TBF0_9BACT|nr:MAG: hypothetical protein DI536_14700 [Archangium gephyra]
MESGTAGALCLGRMVEQQQTRPVVSQENGVWVVRLERSGGKLQEYRCATEAQARQLAIALSTKSPY